MQLNLFSEHNSQGNEKIAINDIFEAYASCRKNKRNTVNAQVFELDYEQHLLTLWKDINEGRYQINPSIAFIVTKPVHQRANRLRRLLPAKQNGSVSTGGGPVTIKHLEG